LGSSPEEKEDTMPEVDDTAVVPAMMEATTAIRILDSSRDIPRASAFDLVPDLAAKYQALVHIQKSDLSHRVFCYVGEIEARLLNLLTRKERDRLHRELDGN
jgi:hypothetical protein